MIIRSVIFCVLFLAALSGFAQTRQDKKEIYEALSALPEYQNIPIVNEPVARIYPYDLDGNYERWLQHTRGSDTVPGFLVCVNAILFSPTVFGYLTAHLVRPDSADLFGQSERAGSPNLQEYLDQQRLIRFAKAPFRSTGVGNLFKKAEAVSFGPILFDHRGGFAFVKVFRFSKKQLKTRMPNKIVVLKQTDGRWSVADTLEEK